MWVENSAKAGKLAVSTQSQGGQSRPTADKDVPQIIGIFVITKRLKFVFLNSVSSFAFPLRLTLNILTHIAMLQGVPKNIPKRVVMMAVSIA